MKKVDKLGCKIPKFDRSEAARKAAQTRKEKYGEDYHSRIGATGGRHRKRGYFGTLKDEGKIDELQSITRKGAETTNAKKRVLRDEQLSREGTAVPGGQ